MKKLLLSLLLTFVFAQASHAQDLPIPFTSGTVGGITFNTLTGAASFDAATGLITFTGTYWDGFGWNISPSVLVAEYHSVKFEFEPAVAADLIEVKVRYAGSSFDHYVQIPNGATSITVPFDKTKGGDQVTKIYFQWSDWHCYPASATCTEPRPGSVSITLKSATLLSTGLTASNDATLKDLKIDNGTITLNPAFNPAVTSYTATTSGLSIIDFTATTNHPNAKVKGDWRKALKEGANSFYIAVTAEDGSTTKNYNVQVSATLVPDYIIEKENLPFWDETGWYSMTASPKTITFTEPTWGGGARWEFDPLISEADYLGVIFNFASRVSANTDCNFYVYDKVGNDIEQQDLSGLNKYEYSFIEPVSGLMITDQDWNSVNIYPYTLTFNEAYLQKKVFLSNADADLSALTVIPGTLDPAFDPAVTSYRVTVENEVEDVFIQATANHPKASVAGAGTKALATGSNPFDIKVTAKDGSEKTYNITVNRDVNAIPSQSISALQIHPNPATDLFTISGLQIDETIRIYDIKGTLLLMKEVPAETENIEIDHLSAGVYLVKAGNKVMKLIKN